MMPPHRIQRQRYNDRPHHRSKEADSGKCHHGGVRTAKQSQEQGQNCASSKYDQHMTAVKEIQLDESEQTAQGQQAPKVGYDLGAGSCRINIMINLEEFG